MRQEVVGGLLVDGVENLVSTAAGAEEEQVIVHSCQPE